MDKKEYPVRLIKWGLIFLGERGIATFKGNAITITTFSTNTRGTHVLKFDKQEIRSAALNNNNGMWTIILKDGRKINITGKGWFNKSKSAFNAQINEFVQDIA